MDYDSIQSMIHEHGLADAARALADVTVDLDGSIAVLQPQSEAARDWLDEHCEIESWQWLGGGLCIDPRCADMLVGAMQADGLTVVT